MSDYTDRYFAYSPDTDEHVSSLSPIAVPGPDLKLVAYYLPQFHPLEHNDKWWGNGFTEWTWVTRARPQFVGHQQPRLPTELGFYDLRIPEVQERQATLARTAGLSAFCFHFYWFKGSTILETPIRNFAENESIDLEFCLSWANHDWYRPGKRHDVLMTQEYSAEDDIAFIAHLARYLTNKKYLRVDGKPLILVWDPSSLPNAKETTQRWRDWCERNGIGPIHICANRIYSRSDPAEYGMDSATQFPPGDTGWQEQNLARYSEPIELLNRNYTGRLFDYRDLVARAHDFVQPPYRLFRAVCPGWDNEARRPGDAMALVGTSPSRYLEYLHTALDQTLQRGAGDKLVFINAWNEWAEAAHLEPDHRFGFAYLEATKVASLRAALAHSKTDQPERTAAILHTSTMDSFEQCLGWATNSYDLFVTAPAHLLPLLETQAADKNVALTTFTAEADDHGLALLLRVLRSIDLGRYGRILNISGAGMSTTPAQLSAARAALDGDPDIGIVRLSDGPATNNTGADEIAVQRLARRLGLGSRGHSHFAVVSSTFLARTSALLPIVAIAGVERVFERPTDDGPKFTSAMGQAIGCSAQAASLSVIG